jgi:hypothetical protein
MFTMTAQGIAKKLYEVDFNLWLQTTAQLLREWKFTQIDYDSLIEEIESMGGRSEKNALESNLRVLLMHLLKWKCQLLRRYDCS